MSISRLNPCSQAPYLKNHKFHTQLASDMILPPNSMLQYLSTTKWPTAALSNSIRPIRIPFVTHILCLLRTKVEKNVAIQERMKYSLNNTKKLSRNLEYRRYNPAAQLEGAHHIHKLEKFFSFSLMIQISRILLLRLPKQNDTNWFCRFQILTMYSKFKTNPTAVSSNFFFFFLNFGMQKKSASVDDFSTYLSNKPKITQFQRELIGSALPIEHRPLNPIED